MVTVTNQTLHWILVVAAVALLYFSSRYTLKYPTLVAFILPPFVCICAIIQNAVMASMDILENSQTTTVKAMLTFHALIIPLLLVICYEVAYLVHKQKSVNFCGIHFEEQHRANRKEFISNFLRFFVWVVTIGIFVINILVNYKWLGNRDIYTGFYDLEGDITVHIIFSLIPAFVLIIFSFYIGMQLWNYGTYNSFIVHATCFNPWIWVLVGSLALLVGKLMPNSIYPVSSNAGEILMLFSIVRMFREVHHDLQQGRQIQVFIDPIDTREYGAIQTPTYQVSQSPAYQVSQSPAPQMTSALPPRWLSE